MKKYKTCPTCKGKGEYLVHLRSHSEMDRCEPCRGSGEVEVEDIRPIEETNPIKTCGNQPFQKAKD